MTDQPKPERVLWECTDCGFAFDAKHCFADGTYSCPSCESKKEFDRNVVVLCGDCAPCDLTRARAAEWGEEMASTDNKRLRDLLEKERERAQRAVAALNRYEELPVDANDRPESWGRLFELLDAVRALAAEEDRKP